MGRDRYHGVSNKTAERLAALSELDPCVACGRKRWVHYLPLKHRREIYPKMDGHKFVGTYKRPRVPHGKVATRAKT
jgi:hypothetical protein